MWVVGVAKASVDKARVEDRSHLVEEKCCSLCTLHRLFPCSDKLLHASVNSLVEVHDTEVVIAAKYVKMDLALHEFELGVERIVPGDVAVLDCISIFRIPVEVLGDQFCIPDVHLYDRYVFVENLV